MQRRPFGNSVLRRIVDMMGKTFSSSFVRDCSSINASFLVDQHGDFDPVIAFSLPTKGPKTLRLNVRSFEMNLILSGLYC